MTLDLTKTTVFRKTMLADVSGVFRIRDGKLAELWVAWDNLAALSLLGHSLPQTTVQKKSAAWRTVEEQRRHIVINPGIDPTAQV